MARHIKLYDYLTQTWVEVDWRYIHWCRLLPGYTLVCLTDGKQYKFERNALLKALSK